MSLLFDWTRCGINRFFQFSSFSSHQYCALFLSSDCHSLCHSGNLVREGSGNRCVFAIPRDSLLPFPFPQNSLGGGGGKSPKPRFSPLKWYFPTVVLKIQESEETARKRQAQESTPLLPRLGILADIYGVFLSLLLPRRAPFCRPSSMIQKPKWETRHPKVLTSSGSLTHCPLAWLKKKLQVRMMTVERRRPAVHRVVDSSSVTVQSNGWHWLQLRQWLKLGVTVVRGERGGVWVWHVFQDCQLQYYSVTSNPFFSWNQNSKKKYQKISQTHSPRHYDIPLEEFCEVTGILCLKNKIPVTSQNSLKFPIPSHSLKGLRKRTSHSPIPIPLGFKGMTNDVFYVGLTSRWATVRESFLGPTWERKKVTQPAAALTLSIPCHFALGIVAPYCSGIITDVMWLES